MIKPTAMAAIALAAATQAQAQTAVSSSQIKHVFVIALENHNWTQPGTVTSPQPIFANQAAPYINSLVTAGNPNAAQTAFASNYLQVPVQLAGSPSGAGAVHPSEPNYIWAEAGAAGPRNDNTPYNTLGVPTNVVDAPSLSATLAANGVWWRSYQEDTDLAKNGSGKATNTVLDKSQYVVPLTNFSGTSADYTNAYNGSHQYDYAVKHNPMAFFTATNGGYDLTSGNAQAGNYAPLQQLLTDLSSDTVAQYNWITPDQFNDMHTALSGGFDYKGLHYTGDAASIAQGDNFLSILVPLIMASHAYRDNGAIVIWDDEAEREDGTAAFTIPEIVISPLAKGNAYNSTVAFDHSSDLRSMQEIFGLTPGQGVNWLGSAATATDLADLFKPGALGLAAPVPEPASWAMMIVGFGLAGGAARSRRGVRTRLA